MGEEKNESYAKKRAVKRNCIDNYWRNILGTCRCLRTVFVCRAGIDCIVACKCAACAGLIDIASDGLGKTKKADV